MAERLWAGLDIGVETTSVCIINDRGDVVHESTCPTAVKSVHRELASLRRRKFARVGLEAATGMNLARGLRNLGYEVDIYEQRKLSKFLRLRRNKSDAGDARGIAEAGRFGGGTVSRVHLKSLDCQFLQSRLTIRRNLIRQRVAIVNLIARQLEVYGGRVKPTKLARFRSTVEVEIRSVFGRAPNDLTRDLSRVLDYCDQVTAYQQSLDCELRRIAVENDVCRRFMEIPGVGPVCALTFYSAIGDPHRFRRATDIGAYFGLVPSTKQSGLMSRTGRISKMGNTAARALLVTGSRGFLRWSDVDSDLRMWASGVEHRSGRRKATIALARKLATVMLAIWKSGDSYMPRRKDVVRE